MTFAERLERELDRAVKAALCKHGTVRAAARALGLPSSTLHDRAQLLGLRPVGKPRRHTWRRRDVR